MNALDRSKQPPVSSCGTHHLPDPLCYQLKNGIPVYAFQGGTQDVVRLDITVEGSMWHQERPLQANTTNKMLREGCSGRSSQDIADTLEFYGSWLNLYCIPSRSVLTIYCMGRYFEQSIEVVRSLISEPTFPETEFRNNVSKSRQNFRIGNGKMSVLASQSFSEHLFGGHHPYGRFAREEDYDTLTIDHLRHFFNTYYHPQNMTFYASGNVTDEKLKIMDRYLGGHFGSDDFTKAHTDSFSKNASTRQRVFIEHDNAVQSCIKIGCQVMKKSDPDFVKFNVLNTILGGYFGSRLMSNIREDKGYTYGISSQVATYPDSGVFCITTEADNQYVPFVVEEIYHEIDRLQNSLIDQTELDMVKNYMLGEICRMNEGPFAPNEAYLSLHTNGLTSAYFDRVLTETSGVTAQELQALACKYLDKGKMLEVIAGKKI